MRQVRRFVIAGAAFGVLLSASAAVAIAPGWSIEQTPNPPNPYNPTGGSGIELDSVSCVSARDCTAVAPYFTGNYTSVALAEHWNGSEWSIEHTPNTGSDGLYGVSCVSASACTAVGYKSRGALAERWNGTKWSIEHTPNTSGDELRSVSCVSASACTAVGSYVDSNGRSTPLAERWNGTKWSIEHTPNTSGGLFSVSCVSASACTAVGRYAFHGTLAERWNGTDWAIEQTPNPHAQPGSVALSGVSCASASACTAIGEYLTSADGFVVLVERSNASKWSIQQTPKPNGESPAFDSVSCVSARDCTAVGAYFTSADAQVALAERWNGSEWSIEQTPNSGSALSGVSCVSASACTAVGQHYLHGNTDGVTLAERWRG